MLIKETYSKNKSKKKRRRKPFIDALLKAKENESNLSFFGALNAKNIKKVKASIRNNVKGKENKKVKEAKILKIWPVVNVPLDDTFDRLFNNSASRNLKQSTPIDDQGTINNYSNAKRKSLLESHSPVLFKSISTHLQKSTRRREAFRVTSTPISSPNFEFDDRRSKVSSEQRSVNQPQISSTPLLFAPFRNLSTQLFADKEYLSPFDQLRCQSKIRIEGSPDMFSSAAEYSVNNSNKCVARKVYLNRQQTNISCDLDPSVQIISDSSSNLTSTKSCSLKSSCNVAPHESISETCNFSMSKEEILDSSKRSMINTGAHDLRGDTEHIETVHKICRQEELSTDLNFEVNNLSNIIFSELSIPTTRRMKTCYLISLSSNNTSSGSDDSFPPGSNFKIKSFKENKSKNKKRSTVKARKQTNVNRRFFSTETMEDQAVTNTIRKIKSVNIQATNELHEHKENGDNVDQICGLENHSTSKTSELNESSKILTSKLSALSTARVNTSSLSYSLTNNVSSDCVVLLSPVFKRSNITAKERKSKKRSTVKASNQRTIKSAGSIEYKAQRNATRKIKSVDNIQATNELHEHKKNIDYMDQICGLENHSTSKTSVSNDSSKILTLKLSTLSTARLNSSNLSSSLSKNMSSECVVSFSPGFKRSNIMAMERKSKERSTVKAKNQRTFKSAGSIEHKALRNATRKIKSVDNIQDNILVEPVAENLSFWKKCKRMSIARRHSHLVKEISISNDRESLNVFRTSTSTSTSIRNYSELPSRNTLDVVAEEVSESDLSRRESIKSRSDLIENVATASLSCSVLLCSTADCKSRENSCILVNEIESNARDFILDKCGQPYPLPFSEVFTDSYLENCKKIGEGVYGEVFLCDHVDGRSTILKIIPIEGDVIINGEHQKRFNEILTEVLIASELSDLRHDSVNNTDIFSEFIKCWCVVGNYPDKLIQLWNEFSEENGTENDSPTILDENQLFIVLEMRNGGKPLESYVFNSAEQSSSLLLQVAFGLAVAESSLEFEHRDLHWGNVLVAPTQSKTVVYFINGTKYVIPTKGVKATIIDFTLSRMLHKGCSIYNDLSVDPELFTATGDYQFDIYRLMRDKIRSDWINFEPYTNILWLHYLLDKCLKSVYYHRKNTKVHKKYIKILDVWFNEILESNSAIHFVTQQNYS